MAKCVPLLQSTCSRSSLRAAKLVRAQMLSMDALLAADPGVRVIHLLRDPRGVASSRREAHDPSVIGRYSLDNSSQAVRREAVVYCRTAVRDIRVRQVLEHRYCYEATTVGDRGGGARSLEGGGLAPPLLQVGANFENSLALFVPKYFAGPFWSHKRNYSIKKLVEG